MQCSNVMVHWQQFLKCSCYSTRFKLVQLLFSTRKIWEKVQLLLRQKCSFNSVQSLLSAPKLSSLACHMKQSFMKHSFPLCTFIRSCRVVCEREQLLGAYFSDCLLQERKVLCPVCQRSFSKKYQHEELSAFGASLLIFCDEQSTVSIEGILSVEFGVKSLRSYSPCFTRFQFYFSSSFTGILYGVRITFIVGTTKQHLRQF